MKTALELVMQAIITAGWNNRSDGDVDSPTGHFAIVERPSHPGELNDILQSIEDLEDPENAYLIEAFEKLSAGFYGVVEDSNGHVHISGPHTRENVTQWFQGVQHAYGMWANNELHGI